MTMTKPLAVEIRRRISSVLDDWTLTEDGALIDALTTSVMWAVGVDPAPTDPLARERFRTTLAESARAANWDPQSFGDDADPYAFAEQIASAFPGAHFEYQTNAADVRMRRVVVEGEWEVNPLPDLRPEWADGPNMPHEPGPICDETCNNT